MHQRESPQRKVVFPGLACIIRSEILRFPIRYRQHEPFSISFDDLEITYPTLDIPKMAKELASDIKDKIF